ncbi:MAG TPA: alpha/beta fold hydrolase [Candidatus Hydrogenedentes bacterium]|nr:alpha/beta fold hydrolase [Candidatus Hydrogenedentota bacterium]
MLLTQVLILLVFLVIAAIVLLYSWNHMIAPRLATRWEVRAPRIPGTPWLKGASPLSMGPERAHGAVLFIHGFNGAPNHFADLPEKVAQEGWYVRVMVLPGHGTSPRDFRETTPDDLLGAVIEELQLLHERFGNVVLLGHSMGGSLAVLAAAQTGLASGVILAAPYFGLTRHLPFGPLPEWWVRKLSRVIKWIPFPSRMHPIRRRSARKQITAYKWLHSDCGITAMEVARQAGDPAVLEKVRVPALLIQSRNDTVTCPVKGMECFARLRAPWTEVAWLENSDHIVFWDYEADNVTRAVLSFLSHLV